MNVRPIAHGTERGHKMHLHKHVAMCQPCRDAHAAYARSWRELHKARDVRFVVERAVL